MGVKVMGVKTDPVVVRPSALAVNLFAERWIEYRGREGGNILQNVSPFLPRPPSFPLSKTFDWWGGCAVGVPLCGSIGKAGWVYVAAGRIYFNA